MIDKKWIGHQLPESVLPIERSRLQFFAKAIGETDPIYTDAAAARAEGYPDLPAPPTFLFAAELDSGSFDRMLDDLQFPIAKLLHGSYPVLYRGDNGLVAHECILDTRTCKPHVEVDDIAKRLMDFGFHAPTMSFPVPGTLMVEPTESESKAELDRFILAMTTIKTEIDAIASGASDAKDNPLKNAPHTLDAVTAEQWAHPYSRQQAAFPVPWLRELKFWPLVARIDNAYGDRNLVCDCPPIDSYH